MLEQGADINARSAQPDAGLQHGRQPVGGQRLGDTPLEKSTIGGSTPLLFAARSGDVESAKHVDRGRRDVNDVRPRTAITALIIAAHSGNGTLAALLIDKGADVKASPLGYTALHAAVLRGTLRDRSLVNPDPGAGVPLVKALLAHGADANARVLRARPLDGGARISPSWIDGSAPRRSGSRRNFSKST